MDIKTYSDLVEGLKKVREKKERFLIEELKDYIYQDNDTAANKLCLLYGLRRTGKTTMMYQTIQDMTEVEQKQSVYILCNKDDDLLDVIRQMNLYKEKGYNYFFIDEITAIENFIDMADLLSDLYAVGDSRFVLSGTDSLSLYLAEGTSLLDRCKMIHTTFIPYYEFQYLFPNATIDDFIEYGGTLSHENNGVGYFQSIQKTQQYLDSAICDNILHSLEYSRDFRYVYDDLTQFHKKGEIKNIIHRIIQDGSHKFVKNIVLKKFKASVYENTIKNLKNRSPEVSKEMLTFDLNAIMKLYKNKLNVFNIEDKRSALVVEDETVRILKSYLKELDFVTESQALNAKENYQDGELIYNTEILLSQPGIRYSQVQSLIESIADYLILTQQIPVHKDVIENELKNCVKGALLEDIILMNYRRLLSDDYDVLKVLFNPAFGIVDKPGEFDMMIYNKRKHESHLFEIKHDTELGDWQTKHLLDSRKTDWIEQRFGKVKSKVVLYNGENIPKDERGIAYKNCSEFLDELKTHDRNYQKRKERESLEHIQEFDDPFFINEKALSYSFEENEKKYAMVVWTENLERYEIFNDLNKLVETGNIKELDQGLKKIANNLVKTLQGRER